MKSIELIQLQRNTYTVPEIRKMLGLGKTESYWVLQHRSFEITKLNGELRVSKASFEAWYDTQVKYKKVNGPPPGEKLREESYSVHEVAELVGVSDETIYVRVNRGEFETYTVDYCTRITKESFKRWYEANPRYRTKEDREKDQPLLENTYSLPDLRRMLGVHRNVIYFIMDKEGEDGAFEIVYVAGQKRITKKSFWKWYESQSRYHLKECSERVEIQQPKVPASRKKQALEPTPPRKTIPMKKSYRVEDLQDALGITKREAYAMVKNFEIAAVKAGNSYIIPANSFLEFLKERGIVYGND